MRSLALQKLQTQSRSFQYRLRCLSSFDTAVRPRGKTTAKSRGGSFAPRLPANLWKIEVEAINSPVAPPESIAQMLGVAISSTYRNPNTGSRTHYFASPNSYATARASLVARLGLPYVDPVSKSEYWHAPALGQMMLVGGGATGQEFLVQNPITSSATFLGMTTRHNMTRAVK